MNVFMHGYDGWASGKLAVFPLPHLPCDTALFFLVTDNVQIAKKQE